MRFFGVVPDLPYDYIDRYHSVSSVLLSELFEYDYSKTFIEKKSNQVISMKNYLGEGFFQILNNMLDHYPEIPAHHIRI